MSTYIDPRHPNKHGDYKDCPELVVRYLYDSETIRGLSPRTVNGYYIDLRTFFRFLMQAHGLVPADVPPDEIDIRRVYFLTKKCVTTCYIYYFVHYATG